MKKNVTSITSAYTDIFEYKLVYDSTTGNMNFIQNNINPMVEELAVATMVGGYANQVTIANQVFTSIDNKATQIRQNTNSYIISTEREKSKSSNLYASTTNQIFELVSTSSIEKGLWLKPYVVSDTFDVGLVSNVDNTLYGTLAGYDMPVDDDKLLSFYIGYTGGTQKYEDIKLNQTDYVVGMTGMLVKEKWYVGATVNVGKNKATADNNFGSDDIDKTTYSVGIKGGYDFDLGKNWMLQPNMILMYAGVTSSDFTNAQGYKVKDNGLNSIYMQPQVKASWKLSNGWTPYGLLDVAINIGEVKTEVNEKKVDTMKLDPYFEYGLGLNKNFINTAWSCYGEVTGKTVGFNLGIKYAF